MPLFFAASTPENVSFLTLTAMLSVVLIIASCWYGAVAIFFSKPAISLWFESVKCHFDRICGATMIMLGVKQALLRNEG